VTSVTAIVSAYYAERYIRDRINNLQRQRPEPEIIVVAQRGSYEEGVSIAMGGCVHVQTEDIPTIYSAWNSAIAIATGDYLTNANCDDRHNEGALSILAKALDANQDAALVYGDNDVIHPNGVITTHKRGGGGIDVLKRTCFVGPMPMWRRTLHDTYGMFDGTLHSAGDYEFWLRIAKGGEKLLHLDYTVGRYTRRPDSAEFRNPGLSKSEALALQGRYE
jgi:glycosyltransferase involved in cell wall biosynthesis